MLSRTTLCKYRDQQTGPREQRKDDKAILSNHKMHASILCSNI
jgi:hypothetical protein